MKNLTKIDVLDTEAEKKKIQPLPHTKGDVRPSIVRTRAAPQHDV